MAKKVTKIFKQNGDILSKFMVIIPCSQYAKLNSNPSHKSNQIFTSSIHQRLNMTNKTWVWVKVWVMAWIKIYIRHTENTEFLPNFQIHDQ